MDPRLLMCTLLPPAAVNFMGDGSPKSLARKRDGEFGAADRAGLLRDGELRAYDAATTSSPGASVASMRSMKLSSMDEIFLSRSAAASSCFVNSSMLTFSSSNCDLAASILVEYACSSELRRCHTGSVAMTAITHCRVPR